MNCLFLLCLKWCPFPRKNQDPSATTITLRVNFNTYKGEKDDRAKGSFFPTPVPAHDHDLLKLLLYHRKICILGFPVDGGYSFVSQHSDLNNHSKLY